MENSLRLKFGRILSQPPSNEEVVISGISGAFPSADTIEEFEKNLQNKVNMTTRKATEHGVIGVGLFKDKTKFDSGSFAMHLNQSRSLHPIGKLLLEKCYECIFDAGLNPSDLEGTRTGVYMGFCFSEVFLNDVLGYMRSALVNRISAHLKVQGPSVVLDTACSSTGYALDTAYKAIRMGQLDYAIICGAHFLTENITMQFKRLGMLSSDGYSKPFDAKGTGYVRSEGAVAILLQKSANSKRIYAKCIHTKSNCNGFQEQGIMHPSFDAQFQLLDEIYMESGVKLSQVDYVEAHGTGTIVGDPIEVDCLDKFFFPKRQSPILIGSVKSSIGHTEAVSILCSIAKVILAFESGKILPNINYNTPRENLHGIIEGRFKVVTESTPLPSEDSIVGINNSGFGGANAHAILQRFSKRKIHNELPEDLPRLVCVSGRTEEAVQVLLNDIEEKFDVEHIGLIHNIFRKPINNHMFRGYLIVSKNGSLKQSVSKVTLKKNSLIVIFGDLMEISIKFLIDLLALPLLSNFNNQLLQLLAKCKIDFKTINSESPSILKNLLFQLTVAELLKLLEIQYDGVFGYSFGHFACSYYKGSLGLKELVECIAIILKYGKRMGINGSPNVKIDSFMVFKKEIQEDFKKVLPQSVAKHFLEKLFNGPEEYRLHRKYTYVLEIGLSHHQNKSISFGGQLDLLGVLDILGRLFELGVQPQIQFLYPKVEFPVSRGTPMISSKIKWKHNRVWTTDCPLVKNALPKNVYVFEINVDIAIWTDLQGHLIDGRLLLPAICYLDLVWDVFSKLSNTRKANLKVTFENCKFLKACNVSKSLTLEVMIQNSSGNFEICEKDVVVMTGRVSIANKADSLLANSVRQSKEQKNDILLNTKDIYKELHLRGYNYKGKFKSLAEANASGTQGKIKWQGNWVTFIDNMLQMKILSYDTRSLYVPTEIKKLTIDPTLHTKIINQLKNKNSAEVELSVTVDPDTGIISSGGMTIEGLMASPISRKKTTAVPVLEKYQFVSNQDHIPMHESIRVFMQVFLENHSTELKISVVELNQEGYNPIGPVIREVLDDQPLVQSNIVLLTDQTLELEGVTVENKNLSNYSDYSVVVAGNLLTNNQLFTEANGAVKAKDGYLISREPLNINVLETNLLNFDILNAYNTGEEQLVFLRRSVTSNSANTFIKIEKFNWLKELKEAIEEKMNVIIWCQNETTNGIIGLINCLRREPETHNVRALFILDNAPKFDPELPFYKNQLSKGFAINVYANKSWGTYRHLRLENVQEVESEHCFINSKNLGDLSSLKWFEGPLSLKNHDSDLDLIQVYYSALNFKDVMLASARISPDSVSTDRREQQCMQGFEFSGKTQSGKRVMGMLKAGALSTLVKVDPVLLWEVPQHWSLKDAVTVPVVYSTCLYALVLFGKIKPSNSVLIHSGTGGIGQAAINICLNMGCKIFITVGTEEKRAFIRENFPQINENCIGNSRDLSFEQMIMRETHGKGVDIILNSLAEEKLETSVRCLSPNGRFLEIGKFDMSKNNSLKLLPFKNGGSYHGIMLDQLISEQEFVKFNLNKLLQKFIDSGAVKPLMYTVFEKNNIEQAYRFMTTGKHIGKVLVEIQNENSESNPIKFKGLPYYFCLPDKSYVICGGLGGFGLELVDWLVLRGARNLVLTSRNGIKTGYQAYRIKIWNSYGCNIKIFTEDIANKTGCENLLNVANSLAPVVAIFNLAVLLKDAIFANQTEESFEISFRPKAFATQNLDVVSRYLCPQLRDFVIFSSVSCGRGNAGQTNYGMSNSVMERICEKRHKDGYPALAVQWGAIGDVGLVAELQENHIELEIGGTLQQSISSCLQVLDTLLKQKESAIVSSMVVAEKRVKDQSGDIMQNIATILGLRDLKSLSLHSTLAELGMDSINGVEVKQTLERDYNIFLAPNEIRHLTLAKIKDLNENNNTIVDEVIPSANDEPIDWTAIIEDLLKYNQESSTVVKLKTMKSESEKLLPRVILFPGIEGVCHFLSNLTQLLDVKAFGINYISSMQQDSFPEMAEILLPFVLELIEPNKPFHIIAHSLGSIVALEIIKRLESLGYNGTVTFLDGSPTVVKWAIKQKSKLNNMDDILIEEILKNQLGNTEAQKIMTDIVRSPLLEDKLHILSTNLKMNGYTEDFVINATTAILKRMKACDYTPAVGKLKSKVYLFKPKNFTQSIQFGDDYDLGQYFEKQVVVKEFEGTHNTILENKDLAAAIMNILCEV